MHSGTACNQGPMAEKMEIPIVGKIFILGHGPVMVVAVVTHPAAISEPCVRPYGRLKAGFSTHTALQPKGACHENRWPWRNPQCGHLRP